MGITYPNTTAFLENVPKNFLFDHFQVQSEILSKHNNKFCAEQWKGNNNIKYNWKVGRVPRFGESFDRKNFCFYKWKKYYKTWFSSVP